MTATQVYEILGIVGLGLASAIGVLLAALQLPGTWIIFCAAVVYDWAHDWQRMGPTALAVFAGLVVGAEILEQVSGMVLTGRAGGSKRASWGGLIGGIAGMFLFTFPVPVIGTIAGGIVGCFAGALIGELTVRDDLCHGARVGVAAALGRIAGMLAKLLVAFVLAGASLSLAIFSSE